jgi:hypothetical protein
VCGGSKHCQPTLSDLSPKIVQAVPTPDSAEIPSSSPVVLFLDGTYDNVNIEVNAHTGAAGTSLPSTVTKLASGAGNDILVVSSTTGFPLGASVVMAISGDVKGTLVFNVAHDAPASADETLGFEGVRGPKNLCTPVSEAFSALPLGWKSAGDVGLMSATGSLSATEGDHLAVMTTGEAACGSALDGTSSLLVSGPITAEGAEVSFDYNFQSSEFDDYCGSTYDDTFLAVLKGPKGVVAKVVSSVNVVCEGGHHTGGSFPTMPDGGNAVYKETGVESLTMEGDVGSPAFLAFIVTDVADSALSTVVGIDRVRVGE